MVVIAIVSSSGIAAVVVKLIDVFSNRRSKRDAMQEARDTILVSIAGDNQIRVMHACLNDGFMTLPQRRWCEKLHKAYKVLGGNDIVDSLWEQCKELPLEPPK